MDICFSFSPAWSVTKEQKWPWSDIFPCRMGLHNCDVTEVLNIQLCVCICEMCWWSQQGPRAEEGKQIDNKEKQKGKRWIQCCSFHLFPPSHSSVLRFLLLFWRLSGFTRPCCMETSGNERIFEMITYQMGSGVYRRNNLTELTTYRQL